VWGEMSEANRRRAEHEPRTTAALVASVDALAGDLARQCRLLAQAIKDCDRPRLADEQLRDRVEDLMADLVLTVDLLAAGWSMDVARALAQRFNERGIRDGYPERINPQSRPGGRSPAVADDTTDGSPGQTGPGA
jgi:hypothetical protein